MTFASLMNFIFLFLNILLAFANPAHCSRGRDLSTDEKTKVMLRVFTKMWHQMILVIKLVGKFSSVNNRTVKRSLIHVILGFLILTLIFHDRGRADILQ